MKIYIESLGCSKNLVDSELILGSLKKSGHQISSEEEAEVIIVNTCGFIGDAKKESLDAILDLSEHKKTGNCKKLIVTGCMVERYSQELSREIPEVDAFWGTGNLLNINEILEQEKPEKINHYPPGTLYDPDSPRIMLTPSHSAFVKVSEGCSRTCSFCIIPKMRGIMKSRAIDSIVGEINSLAQKGVREINLIAQDMTSYGRDIGTNLETMLRESAKVQDIEWIRIHYWYPWGITDSLVELIGSENNILPYIDMPLQHINDRVLRSMDRKTTGSRIRDIIKKLRSTIDDVILRTTLIVGFPGETEDEFEELLEFVEETKFERAGAFKYSQEEGTPAGVMGEQVPEEIKEERFERLMQTQSEVSFTKNKSLIGTVHEGFVESVENGNYVTRISSQAPEVDGYTYIKRDQELILGEMVDIRITGADIYDLYGEVID
ncbi:MAG: 30S ribosomal protein S12 methylthiotransferase RimO [Thermodesulfobacteriota bacterium]